MAANFQPLTIFSLSILLILSSIPQSFSQSEQNIETFYPVAPPHPPPINPPPQTPVDDPRSIPLPTTPTPPTQPSSSPPRSSTRAAVGRAIGVTVASTLVLSGLLFFLLLRYSKRKRERRESANVTAPANGGGTNPPVPQNDNFMCRFQGNLKGVIVDENGLDVLYWRDLEEGENRTSFKKQHYKNLKDEQKEEEKRVVSSGRRSRKSEPPIQEVHLLRGKSSTSQSPAWVDKEDQTIKKAPSYSYSTGKVLKVEPKQDSSVQLVQYSTATPTLPPPPGAQARATPPPPPPQPPLPSVTVAAVPKEKTAAAPPPPPPIPKNKSPAPPPPQPPSADASASKPPAMPSKRSSSEGGSSTGSGQVKLKPLHWDKVNPNVEHSMVWDKMNKGSFKFDGDLMEALFGYVATNRISPQRDNRSISPMGDKSGPPSQIFILDTRKSQNTAIVLKSLGISRQEIIDALQDGQGLNADTLEKLTRIAPTDEEKSEILAFNGDPTRLADAESFLYHLLKAVPSAFTRFSAMLFRSTYDSEVLHIKDSLKSLESACQELRTRGLFLKLLEAVLKAGNRLNAGTSRGNAQAFNLTALRKLSDVKSSDGKTTLLQFVVQEVVRAEGKRCVLNKNQTFSRTNSQSSNAGAQIMDNTNKDDKEREYMMLGLPVIGGLSNEFTNVKKVATLDYDFLVKTISELSLKIEETRKVVQQCETGGSRLGFAETMKGFLDTAELEIRIVKEEQIRVMEVVKKTRDYYQAGNWKDKGGNNMLQLFVIVKDFLGMVDQVCVDIARNVQQKRKAGSGSGSGSGGTGSSMQDSPRVFRFPKLPPNFMSDSSRSSSSDEDDDGDEVRR